MNNSNSAITKELLQKFLETIDKNPAILETISAENPELLKDEKHSISFSFADELATIPCCWGVHPAWFVVAEYKNWKIATKNATPSGIKGKYPFHAKPNGNCAIGSGKKLMWSCKSDAELFRLFRKFWKRKIKDTPMPIRFRKLNNKLVPVDVFLTEKQENFC